MVDGGAAASRETISSIAIHQFKFGAAYRMISDRRAKVKSSPSILHAFQLPLVVPSFVAILRDLVRHNMPWPTSGNINRSCEEVSNSSFRSLLGNFRANLPVYRNDDPTKATMQNQSHEYNVNSKSSPAQDVHTTPISLPPHSPPDNSASSITMEDIATAAIDIPTEPKSLQSQIAEGLPVGISNSTLPIPQLQYLRSESTSISSSTASTGSQDGDSGLQPFSCGTANAMNDFDRLHRVLTESIQWTNAKAQEQNREMSKLEQTAMDMQTWLIKTNQENLTLSLELQQLRALQFTETKLKEIQAAETTANARLLEVENKFTRSERERKSLEAELEIVSSKKRKLETTLEATDSAAKARFSKIEDRLVHSENERKALYDDNTSLKADNAKLRTELEIVNSIYRQLEVTIQTNKATNKATQSDIDGKLIKSEYDRSALDAANTSLQDELKSIKELKCTLMENLESVTSDLEASERELLATKGTCDRELLAMKETYDRELLTVKEKCAKLSKSNTKFDAMCAQLTQALLAKQNEVAACKRVIDRLSARLNVNSHAHG